MLHGRADYERIQDPLNQIPMNEPVFLLRAQDRTAVEVIECWIKANEVLEDADQQLIEGMKTHLQRVKDWSPKKTADGPVL